MPSNLSKMAPPSSLSPLCWYSLVTQSRVLAMPLAVCCPSSKSTYLQAPAEAAERVWASTKQNMQLGVQGT